MKRHHRITISHSHSLLL